jgi:hypothetical protein
VAFRLKVNRHVAPDVQAGVQIDGATTWCRHAGDDCAADPSRAKIGCRFLRRVRKQANCTSRLAVLGILQVYRTPAGSIVRELAKPTPLVCLDVVREFLIQPRLRLTSLQIRRLWNLTPEHCAAVLQSLVADGFLEIEPDGRYVLCINKMYRTA